MSARSTIWTGDDLCILQIQMVIHGRSRNFQPVDRGGHGVPLRRPFGGDQFRRRKRSASNASATVPSITSMTSAMSIGSRLANRNWPKM